MPKWRRNRPLRNLCVIPQNVIPEPSILKIPSNRVIPTESSYLPCPLHHTPKTYSTFFWRYLFPRRPIWVQPSLKSLLMIEISGSFGSARNWFAILSASLIKIINDQIRPWTWDLPTAPSSGRLPSGFPAGSASLSSACGLRANTPLLRPLDGCYRRSLFLRFFRSARRQVSWSVPFLCEGGVGWGGRRVPFCCCPWDANVGCSWTVWGGA